MPTADDPAPDQRLTMTTFELDEVDATVRLTVYSTDPREDMREQVYEGGAIVPSNLKSLLETGRPMPGWHHRELER